MHLEIFPISLGFIMNCPVFLRRIDGHGAIANGKALELAGVTKSTKIDGGDLIMKNGELTGVLIDNAMGWSLQSFRKGMKLLTETHFLLHKRTVLA